MVKDGEGPKIKGSIMLALSESKEDVLKALQEDIYFTEGVWDWNKIQIYPVCSCDLMLQAFRRLMILEVQICL